MEFDVEFDLNIPKGTPATEVAWRRSAKASGSACRLCRAVNAGVTHGVAFFYCWSAALGAPIAPMTWWSWHHPPLSEPATDEGCAEATAREVELIGVIYRGLLEEVDCADCGARLVRP
jgi:hypothetical protein